jgi:trehalose-phosphatase
MSPRLFDDVQEVEQRVLEALEVLLCLDYDGTLTHFTATPDRAHLSPQMQQVLTSLAERGVASVAVISGRDRADLQERVGIPGLTYAGNHGLEISGPGFMFVEPTAASYVGPLKELSDQLGAKLQGVSGALVENKGLTLSVHYRQVPEGHVEQVRQLVHAALAATTHPFVLTTGNMVFEIRPRVYWNKGNAIGWIKKQLGKPDAVVVYVGDDTTDEDAFVVLKDDITIKVGEAAETAARYTLSGPAEVRTFLEWFDDLLRRKASSRAHGTPGKRSA